MGDKRIQTPNFGLQMIGDGTRWTDMTRTTPVAGVVPGGSEELEPADFNTMLTMLDGTLTPNAGLVLAGGTIAAAGTVQADATAVIHRVEIVTGANATVGVRLPPAVSGAVISLKNNGAAVLKVYPAVGETINAIAANSPLSMASLTACDYICGVAGAWFSDPLLPS